jgi:soluble lytic murein transglycosylase-like protein
MDATAHIAGAAARASERADLGPEARARLLRAAQDFEALFLGYMMKSMRAASPTGGESEGFGGEMMMSLADMQFAQHLSRSHPLGVAEMVYRELTGEPMPKAEHGSAAAGPPRESSAAVAASTRADVPAAGAASPPREARPPVASPRGSSPREPETQRGVTNDARQAEGAVRQVEGSMPEAASSPRQPAVSLRRPASVARHAVADRVSTYVPYINQASEAHAVDANLIKAVIAAESSGRPDAVSPRNARGLMQLIDSTARAMGVRNVWDPRENILGGTRYLRELLDRFAGDVRKAVAGYNAGPGAVARHGGIPPYPETQKYVEDVLRYLDVFSQQKDGVDGNE